MICKTQTAIEMFTNTKTQTAPFLMIGCLLVFLPLPTEEMPKIINAVPTFQLTPHVCGLHIGGFSFFVKVVF